MTADASRTTTPARTLIAGVGDGLRGDDGFGVEAVRRLAAHPLPDGVEIADTTVRGVHLAHRMLRGYHTVLLVDACARGAAPGTVHVLDGTTPAPAHAAGGTPDGPPLTPDAVLGLLDTLGAGTGAERPQRVLVVGCEPADAGEDVAEGAGLSEPVAAAVDEVVRLILRLVGAAEPDPAAEPDLAAELDLAAEPDLAADGEEPPAEPAAPEVEPAALEDERPVPSAAPDEVPVGGVPVPDEAAVAAPGPAVR